MFCLKDDTTRIFPTFYAATRNRTHISSAAPLWGTLIQNALPTELPRLGQCGWSCFAQTETTLLNRTVEFSFLAASEKKPLRCFGSEFIAASTTNEREKSWSGEKKNGTTLIWSGSVSGGHQSMTETEYHCFGGNDVDGTRLKLPKLECCVKVCS